ncbi:MAG: hypothetical protein M1826_002536 [Phylliscum demangeonii]|nr:MAG: hypothetical protein M1826_002536 [Phylliscum demangeonii]
MPTQPSTVRARVEERQLLESLLASLPEDLVLEFGVRGSGVRKNRVLRAVEAYIGRLRQQNGVLLAALRQAETAQTGEGGGERGGEEEEDKVEDEDEGEDERGEGEAAGDAEGDGEGDAEEGDAEEGDGEEDREGDEGVKEGDQPALQGPVEAEPEEEYPHRNPAEDSRSDGGNAEDETTVEPEQGNVLSHIISQLRPGADLSRVVLPTFILEPRSMLERITNFMAHPETLLPMPDVEDPVQRFVSVVKFYLSGWHIKPPGVKKPLNPILGEYYTCYWDYADRTRGFYIAEQTSHHPPKSSYFYMAPEHHLRIDGTLKPRSKFLGNSAASMMEGIAILRILNRGRPGHGEK